MFLEDKHSTGITEVPVLAIGQIPQPVQDVAVVMCFAEGGIGKRKLIAALVLHAHIEPGIPSEDYVSNQHGQGVDETCAVTRSFAFQESLRSDDIGLRRERPINFVCNLTEA